VQPGRVGRELKGVHSQQSFARRRTIRLYSFPGSFLDSSFVHAWEVKSNQKSPNGCIWCTFNVLIIVSLIIPIGTFMFPHQLAVTTSLETGWWEERNVLLLRASPSITLSIIKLLSLLSFLFMLDQMYFHDLAPSIRERVGLITSTRR
jgi:hypothetical protein